MKRLGLLPLLCFVLLVASGLAAQPAQAQQPGASFVDGVIVGGGISFYLGDLDANPDNDVLKFVGSSNLNLLLGADKRYGNYGLGLDLRYDRLAGERQFGRGLPPYSFTNNAVSLHATGSYDLGFISPNLFRLYAGIGPTLLINPTYEGLSEADGFEDYGTRAIGSLNVGVSVQEALRVGLMLTPTDYLDGFEGSYGGQDFLGYVSLNYRFDFTD